MLIVTRLGEKEDKESKKNLLCTYCAVFHLPHNHSIQHFSLFDNLRRSGSAVHGGYGTVNVKGSKVSFGHTLSEKNNKIPYSL